MLETGVLTAIFLLSAAAAYILVPTDKYKKPYITLALLAVLVRTAIVSYLYSAGTEVSGTDGLLYHQEGIGVARQLAEGVPLFDIDYSYTWYTVFVGLIYHIFGVNRYIVSYINIAFAFVSGLLLLKMALNQKYKFTNAAFISLAFLYFPNLALWTADSRKESLLIFISLLCWYQVQRFTACITDRKGSMPLNICRIVMVCLLMWLGTLIRIYMFIPLAAGIMISQLMLYKKTLSRMSVILAVAVAASAITIFFATMNPLTNGYHAITFSNEPTTGMAQEVSSKMQTVKTIASGRNIAVSVAAFVMLPYPGSINIPDLHGNRTLELIVSMDMLAWYVCLLLMIPGIYKTIRKKESYLLGILAFLGVYVFINALVVENVADTIYRYRSITVGMALLFINGNVLRRLYERIEKLTLSLSVNAKRGIISNFSIKQ